MFGRLAATNHAMEVALKTKLDIDADLLKASEVHALVDTDVRVALLA
jgi:hypothetical protein